MAVKYGAVPMFVLLPEVRLNKRLDIRGAADEALDRAVDAIDAGFLN